MVFSLEIAVFRGCLHRCRRGWRRVEKSGAQAAPNSCAPLVLPEGTGRSPALLPPKGLPKPDLARPKAKAGCRSGPAASVHLAVHFPAALS